MSESSGDEEALAEELRALQAFVDQLRTLLDAIVEDGRHIPRRQQAGVRRAWEEASRDLDALASALTPATPFARMDPLAQHGLSGESLQMKLKAWRSRFFRFGHRMNRSWLRSVLRWGDTILGSLVDVMGVGAAGKEFKEAIENFLEDSAA